ncbi:hypothetical protein EJB05_57252 [Eragrostis curvula]|uniref:DUF668 domain-containing protein n=1 Tax=Eragrostis curvula TaxID=38414 RepID=A0A5J9SGU5_9POAL|nr:hypothetical protein EJB05_57252 [Eragrostis curvula]
MGGLCSKVSAVDKSPSDSTLGRNQVADHAPGVVEVEKPPASVEDAAAKRQEEQQRQQQQQQHQQSFSFLESIVPGLAFQGGSSARGDAGSRASPQLSRSMSQKAGLGKARGGAAKVSEMSSILGRASTVGLEKAVEVLDTLGSSMTSLNATSGFVSNSAAKGNKICMLAFEVANTIVRGCNLMRSFSRPSVHHLKEVVFHSEGVQHLISKDMDELLKIAAADKREELEVFSKEVVRFGNHCKDPQWHNLDRYFEKLASEQIPPRHLKEDAQSVMQQLIDSVQYTSELYHELHTLDRFQSNYRSKQKEQDGSTSKGELHMLKQDLKAQIKHVKNLKKWSLWSKNLEEMMEKLIDIVHFLHLEMYNAFGCADTEEPQEPAKHHNRLGPAGLALHYANTISLIDTFVSRPTTVTSNMRDALYRGLPPTIKSTLRSKLRSFKLKEELTTTQIKAEMERTLQWLVPFVNNTRKAYHGFGWVGEWANTGSAMSDKRSGQMDFTRIETLYHADKEATEAHILELVIWLHHLISKSRNDHGGLRSPIKSPVSSLTQKRTTITLLPGETNNSSPILTQEDQEMLRDVKYRKFIPGISKSQEFDTKPRHSKQSRLSKSNSHSPASGNRKDMFAVRRFSMLPVIDFEVDRTKALDLIDRLDDLKIQ